MHERGALFCEKVLVHAVTRRAQWSAIFSRSWANWRLGWRPVEMTSNFNLSPIVVDVAVVVVDVVSGGGAKRPSGGALPFSDEGALVGVV